jgi:hypothetical protein
MPYSGDLGSQCAVSGKEQLRLLLLLAVSRNQAASAHATGACASALALELLPWGVGVKSMCSGAGT